MRVVIQRVSEASVKVVGEIIGQIDQGLVVLVGFEEADGQGDLDWMANKILNLRIFNDKEGKMNYSVQDVQGKLLIVSQFTLHASTKKGNRPSYIKAAKPDQAIPLYNRFVEICRETLPCETGEFGADMKVSLINDGPVTISIDSQNRE